MFLRALVIWSTSSVSIWFWVVSQAPRLTPQASDTSSSKECISRPGRMTYKGPHGSQVTGWEEGTKCQAFKDSASRKWPQTAAQGHLQRVSPGWARVRDRELIPT